MADGMILIMESGATKTECCLCDEGGDVHSRFRMPGINVASMSRQAVTDALEGLAPIARWRESVTGIFFYGAGVMDGCRGDVAGIDVLDDALGDIFPSSCREYNSDMLAAARALCGDRPGVVAILGTGSNSCSYDGRAIVRNIRPGGFILGDEGSAAVLGKMFLSDYIKGLVPERIADDFSRRYGLGYKDIVSQVYGSGTPSRNLASFAPYLLEMRDEPYVGRLLADNFRNFFERSLLRYDEREHGIYVAGSFGYACRDILQDMGAGYGLRFAGFMQSPMDALAGFHCKGKRIGDV